MTGNSRGRTRRIGAAAALLLAAAGPAAAGEASSDPAGTAASADTKREASRDSTKSSSRPAKPAAASPAAESLPQATHERVRMMGQTPEDNVISARVKAALLQDPVVSTFVVSVETYKGVVLLSGFVKNGGQAKRAADIAAGVRGVQGVRNALSVRI